MHIGMIVGIGPAATDYYYRQLISRLAVQGCDLELTMAHADTPTLLKHQAGNHQDAQVAIYLKLADRLKLCGVQCIAVTSIAGHFCIEAFKKVSPLPVIDLLEVVRSEVQTRAYKRVGLLGTHVVMASHFYGVLKGVEVIPPADMQAVHDAYVAMATAGKARPEHHEVLMSAAHHLVSVHGCEAILLAGTDLALVFTPQFEPGFEILDCAEVHAAQIANLAIG